MTVSPSGLLLWLMSNVATTSHDSQPKWVAAVARVQRCGCSMSGNQRSNKIRATTSWPNAVKIARYIRPVAAITAAY